MSTTSPRCCLITGANRGMGLEYARQLLARGDRVLATCRHPGKAFALNALAGENPGRLHVLPLDVADSKSRAALMQELPLVLGGSDEIDGSDEAVIGIDLLVNNAGVLPSGERFGHVLATTLDDSFLTNAAGPFLLTQLLAPHLADGARVANMSSQLGSITGKDAFRTPSYSISKAALNMATVLLARALAERGIVVIALDPGWVRTDMGGDDAGTSAADAVSRLLKVVENAGVEHSGRFVDSDGKPVAW